VLEQHAREAGGNRGDHQQPGEVLVLVADAAVTHDAHRARDDLAPLAPVVDEQRKRGGDVQPDDEREIERFVLRLGLHDEVPVEPGGNEHRMPEAGNREELGDALQQSDEDRAPHRERVRGRND
jgi:hypothetical protein